MLLSNNKRQQCNINSDLRTVLCYSAITRRAMVILRTHKNYFWLYQPLVCIVHIIQVAELKAAMSVRASELTSLLEQAKKEANKTKTELEREKKDSARKARDTS